MAAFGGYSFRTQHISVACNKLIELALLLFFPVPFLWFRFVLVCVRIFLFNKQRNSAYSSNTVALTMEMIKDTLNFRRFHRSCKSSKIIHKFSFEFHLKPQQRYFPSSFAFTFVFSIHRYLFTFCTHRQNLAYIQMQQAV